MNVTQTYSNGYGSVTSTDKYADLEISYFFEPGKEYVIEGSVRPSGQLFTPGPKVIQLYEITDDSELILTEWLVTELLADKYTKQFQ